MHNQIKVEFTKIRKSTFFYLAIAAFATLSLIYSYEMIFDRKLSNSGAQAFLEAVNDTSLIFIMTMFASYFIGNDFANRTIDNEIRVGCSRLSVILSRAIVVLPFTVVPYLSYVIINTLYFSIFNGFGSTLKIKDMFILLILFVLQVMAIQSFTIFIMFVFKKASLGMMISVCFSAITCNILRNFLEEGQLFFKYTSFYRIMMNNQNMTSQDILISFVSAIVNLLIMALLTYIVFKKADLK